MRIILKHILPILIILICFVELKAQKECGAAEYKEKVAKSSSEFIKNQKTQDKVYSKFINRGGSSQMRQSEVLAAVYTIPVVVHVLWNSSESKITSQQVESQITALNKDFQLLNDDANLTPSVFLDNRANCQISFCLAKKDPNGNPTSGIIYKSTTRSYFVDVFDDAKLSIFEGDDAWDRDNYLNIWVVPKLLLTPFSNTELKGSASPPGGLAPFDGVVIGYKFFGTEGTLDPAYNLGRTATHEIGHWLNLEHIWGGLIPTCWDSDGVDDTPNQLTDNANLYYGGDNPFHLSPFIPKISCDNSPDGEMFMNYMDYTLDAGMNMFTLGQKDKMFALFQLSGLRFPMVSSQACVGIPDLRILEPDMNPSSVIAGNTVDLNFTERNEGSEIAIANYVNIHLSQDDVLTPGLNGDIYLDQYFVNQNITPFSQTEILSKQITIPASVSPGVYYLFFAADGSGVVNEFDEDNNFATIVINVSGACTDLIVLGQSISPLSCTPGGSVSLSFKEKNIGEADAGPNYVNFHLSADNILTPGLNGDIYLDQYFINQPISSLSQTSLINKEIIIPATVTPGTYYVFLAADGQWDISECNNNNNFASAILTVSGGDASLVSYRYWFDNQFANSVIVNGSFGMNQSLQTSISTNSLQNGLHSFTVGFKDVNKWSSFTSSFFYKLNTTYPAGSPHYEYWFDDKFSNRTYNYFSNATDLIVLDALNTSQLDAGLHIFNIRFKPDGKHWSSTISSFFYMPDPTPDPNNKIIKYRYWFDDANNNIVTVDLATPESYLLLIENLCTIGLSVGDHQVHFQFMNSQERWSSIITDAFFKDGTVATFYRDADADGYGNAAVMTQRCSAPVGYVSNNSDCNDNNINVHPGATEVCNGIDDNCDGQTDEAVKTTFYRDADGDGFGNPSVTQLACSAPNGYVANNTDCNDGNAAINPNTIWYLDSDNDNYYTGSEVTQCAIPGAGYKMSGLTGGGDCNDANATVHPGAVEICNSIDDDCDGQIDEGVKTTFYRDTDGDGYGNPAVTIQACSVPAGYLSNNTDCNDANTAVHPGATEVCGNNIDDNCNGQIDEGCTNAVTIRVADATVLESAGPAILSVNLSRSSNLTIAVKFKTENGTAKSPKDYTATTGTVTFSPGQTFKTISVPIIRDNITEGTETFFISLSKPTNATILDGSAIVSIIESSPGLTKTNIVESQTKEIDNQLNITLPNPQHKNEQLRILGIEPGSFDLILIDENGKEVAKIKNYRNNWSMARLTSGIYFYQIIYINPKGELKLKTGKIFIID